MKTRTVHITVRVYVEETAQARAAYKRNEDIAHAVERALDWGGVGGLGVGLSYGVGVAKEQPK